MRTWQLLDWFRELPEQPVESVREAGVLFYFRDFGPLDSDANKSPVVNVFLPVRKRGVLTTIESQLAAALPAGTGLPAPDVLFSMYQEARQRGSRP